VEEFIEGAGFTLEKTLLYYALRGGLYLLVASHLL
jgi:hypothetical protein